ncbi:hypothetical protein EF903_08415 [Streptomyces sp. WAC05292]|nr:hypothetical protein EF903_08415 [Streptomyces sp. WAC05292]
MVFPPERWTPCPATDWTCAVPAPARDCDWILVVELLLKETVGAEHAAAAFAAPARPPAPAPPLSTPPPADRRRPAAARRPRRWGTDGPRRGRPDA